MKIMKHVGGGGLQPPSILIIILIILWNFDPQFRLNQIIILKLIFFFFRAAICCVGCMYEKLGRMMGRSYEETVQILIKSLRNAESQTRVEVMCTLEKVCAGMGSAVSNVHKDIYKAARHCLTDRVMAVRCAAAKVSVMPLWSHPLWNTPSLLTYI